MQPADQKLAGGPSVLYDAVAVLVSEEGAAMLSKDKTAKDFVNDAFAHCKFIGYAAEAMPLFEKTGLAADMDEGCIALSSAADATGVVAACRKLRVWDREPKVKPV